MGRRLAILLPIYVVLYAGCWFAAFQLRYDFELTRTAVGVFSTSVWLALAVKCAAAGITKEWRRRHRYTTLADLLHVSAGAAGAAAVLFVFNLALYDDGPSIPRSVILIDGLLTILAVSTLRGTVRLHVERVQSPGSRLLPQRTLIYGASQSAIAILRTLKTSASEYRVVGFVDDSGSTARAMIGGVRVYPAERGLLRIVKKLRVKHVLVPSTVAGQTIREMLRNCDAAGVKAHVIPTVHEIVDGRYKLGVRDVTISDLLRREPARLDMESIRGYVTGRRVLVTGAAGSIGSELCRQILALEPGTLVLLDQSESGIFAMEQEFKTLGEVGARLEYCVADVGDQEPMDRIMAQFRPELMFHAAAYKHVPLMEENPHEAIRNNIFGTKNCVDLADRYEVERFVLISTDKAVRPSSIMGSSKLMAEKYLQSASTKSDTRFITVRFGNVLDSVGSVVPTFRRQIQSGGPVTVTHPDMKRYFMTIPEAVQLVLQAGAVGESGDVLILDMGEPVKIVDLARDMIYLSGLRCPDDVEIVFTGLRPGEKLYEELFYGSEEGARKVHDKIFCARREGIHPALMARHLSQLDAALDESRSEAATTLRRIVAEYVATDDAGEETYKSAA